MKLREVVIRNFRGLVDVRVPIDDTTVLVGENNSGKTAFLDALTKALPTTGYGRGNPFDEYDYHMAQLTDSPRTSSGILIELWFREDTPGEWSESIIQSLSEVIQTDPFRSLNFVALRVSSHFDEGGGEFNFEKVFLNGKGEPLEGKASSLANVNRFLEYVRLFYLSALRDSNLEFLPRSQFWGRILRDLKIDNEKRQELAGKLTKLNESLLTADARLEQVRASLEAIQNVLPAAGKTSIQPLPLQPWDLMAKSQVVIRGKDSDVDFPLSRHGQGMQSLAVLFLFHAYVEVLLKPTFHADTAAILLLEEPEAHLHPHAVRALTAIIHDIAAQKLLTTHSPYVLQNVPITALRLFRTVGGSTVVRYVKRHYTVAIPKTPDIVAFCKNNSAKYDYHETEETLTVHGRVLKEEYRALLPIYAQDRTAQARLKQLAADSELFITDSDIADLDTYAKRVRGEVFFARGWLLCEGQTEYLLLAYFSELLGTPLDRAGITVVDFQNNGSPQAFVALARIFEIPWLLVCDHDDAGLKFVAAVKKLGVPAAEAAELLRPLPQRGDDLELFLVENGFVDDFKAILAAKGVTLATNPGDPSHAAEVADRVRDRKKEYGTELIRHLRGTDADAARIPGFFAKAIHDILSKAQ
ncbi:MAG TPA: AAA family ATPase [Pirellulales bacterium]|nr:AAA family ATPase [Pirellulales bacterium]